MVVCTYQFWGFLSSFYWDPNDLIMWSDNERKWLDKDSCDDHDRKLYIAALYKQNKQKKILNIKGYFEIEIYKKVICIFSSITLTILFLVKFHILLNHCNIKRTKWINEFTIYVFVNSHFVSHFRLHWFQPTKAVPDKMVRLF